jgi:hypothetical protein
MAVGAGGCGRTALLPRHDGGVSRGDATTPDRAVSSPDVALASKPDVAIDRAIRTPDSNPDRSVDTSPDRPSDSLPEVSRDGLDRWPDIPRDTAVDRNPDVPDLALDRGREVGDTALDRIPDGPARDRALDVSVVASDAAVDTVAGDLVEADGGAWLSVLAGTLTGPGAMDGIGPSAQFYFPSGVAYDGAGNLYVADSGNNTIRKMVLATREVTTVAGLMGVYGSDDGVGVDARLYSPQGLAADGAGNLYIADSANHTIRKMVLSSGKVTTIAGAAGQSGHQDARGSAARFWFPTGLALDGAGNLYVSSDDNTIRRVTLATGDVTTVAGEAMVGGYQDGQGEEVHFSRPKGVVADGAGTLYVADTENCLIRKIVLATGVVSTVAGSFGTWGHDEGIGSEASFSAPQGLALDGTGNLYVADHYGTRIRKMALATATVSNIEGDSNWQKPGYLAYDGAGNLYLSDQDGHTISRVGLATQAVELIAGRRIIGGGKDGVGAEATFSEPCSLVSDQQGGVFLADTDWNTIRRVDVASGRVTTLAGNPDGIANSNDGNGTAAGFNGPIALAYDGHGTLYIADMNNNTIRKLAIETGAVTTLAGSPNSNETRDGMGTFAHFNVPSGVALDGAGNLFVAETRGQVIRKIVLADAMVTTLAGKASSPGSDDGLGGQARFSGPRGVACDGAGNLYVADTGNCTVRQIDIATGRATTLAGEASVWEGRDGTGSGAHFKAPFALAMDTVGRLLVSDSPDSTVRRIDLATKQVTTIVGHSGRRQTVPGFLPAYVAGPAGLAFLPSGDLVISDLEAKVILLARF